VPLWIDLGDSTPLTLKQSVLDEIKVSMTNIHDGDCAFGDQVS
jgi:hypothetical protein